MKTKTKGKKALIRKLHKPYINNRITFTTEFYPSERSSRSLITAGATGSISVKLIHFVAAVGILSAGMMICSKFKKKK